MVSTKISNMEVTQKNIDTISTTRVPQIREIEIVLVLLNLSEYANDWRLYSIPTFSVLYIYCRSNVDLIQPVLEDLLHGERDVLFPQVSSM